MEARTPTLADGSQIDISGPEFALRLSNLLREHRRSTGQRCSTLARSSGGRYRASDLRAIERGRRPAGDPVELTEIYGADLVEILPLRTPIEIDPAGVVRAAGVIESFRPGDDEDMLAAYLRLVRRLRRAERDAVVHLRRQDVEILAGVLQASHDSVHERLSSLMAATRTSRRIAVMAITGGVVVIGLGSIAVASSGADRVTTPSGPMSPGGPSAGVTELVESPDVAVLAPVVPQVVLLPEGSWTAPVPPALTLDVAPLAESVLPAAELADDELADDELADDELADDDLLGPDPTSDDPAGGGSAPPPAPEPPAAAPAPEPPAAAPAPEPPAAAPAPEPPAPEPPAAAPAPEPPAPEPPAPEPAPTPPSVPDTDDDEFDVGAPPLPVPDPPIGEPVDPTPDAEE